MSSEKTDLRIVRTKQLIHDVFIKLMKEKGFNAVTIHLLPENAGINRGTFYLHYKDLFDLLNQMKEEKLSELRTLVITPHMKWLYS